jgi:hypothetical protein
MPVIILTEPFMRHYAGSVFRVSDAIGYSGWDDDDRVRDRQPCFDQRVYHLPDDGKGNAAELSLESTLLCPENLLINEDLKGGPCRITSVSEGLATKHNDPFYASPLPMGRGKVLLQDSAKYTKNIITADIPEDKPYNKVVIKNQVTEVTEVVLYDFQDGFVLDFSEWQPGFYRVDIFYNTTLIHTFTVMKCFPLVVFYESRTRKYRTEKTLW